MRTLLTIALFLATLGCGESVESVEEVNVRTKRPLPKLGTIHPLHPAGSEPCDDVCGSSTCLAFDDGGKVVGRCLDGKNLGGCYHFIVAGKVKRICREGAGYSRSRPSSKHVNPAAVE